MVIPEALLVHPSIKDRVDAEIQSGNWRAGIMSPGSYFPLGIRVFVSPKVEPDAFYAGTVEQILRWLKDHDDNNSEKSQ
jgi:hypothetical protein